MPIGEVMESKRKLTPRTKKLAISGGVALILVLALQFLVFKKPSRPASEYIAPVVHHHPATTSKTHPAKPAPPKIDPTLPPALRAALLHHPVVVAVLYATTAPGDDA